MRKLIRVFRSDTDTLGLDAGIELTVSFLPVNLKRHCTHFHQGTINSDLNSGSPQGFGMAPATFQNNTRSTASVAYLSSPPANLTIITETRVNKILFSNNKIATGVLTSNGEAYLASKEVILSAGAFNSPAILLRSGIGPKADLGALSIPVVHDLPSVGKNLRDHCLVTTTILRKQRDLHLPPDFDPHGTTGIQAPMAFLSSPSIKNSAEFAALPSLTRTYLQKVPSYEVAMTPLPLAGILPEREGAEIFSFMTAILNAQSSGTVTISSLDPKASPVIDPKYLSHPYDQRVAIESLRDLVAYSKLSTFQPHTESVLEGPEGEDDAALLKHAKKSLQPVWHFSGTCRMGKEGDDDENWVVDADFKVRGVSGLRVVDMSVMPLMTNNHTMATAYLVVGFSRFLFLWHCTNNIRAKLLQRRS